MNTDINNIREHFVITMKHNFFAPQPDETRLRHGNCDGVAVFETKAMAEREIEKFDGLTYHLRHNETGRPEMKARKISGLGAKLRAEFDRYGFEMIEEKASARIKRRAALFGFAAASSYDEDGERFRVFDRHDPEAAAQDFSFFSATGLAEFNNAEAAEDYISANAKPIYMKPRRTAADPIRAAAKALGVEIGGEPSHVGSTYGPSRWYAQSVRTLDGDTMVIHDDAETLRAALVPGDLDYDHDVYSDETSYRNMLSAAGLLEAA